MFFLKKNSLIFWLAVLAIFAFEEAFASNGQGSELSLESPGVIHVCYEDRNHLNLNVSLKNVGIDTLSQITCNWLQSEMMVGQSTYATDVIPNTSFAISGPSLGFPFPGSYTLELEIITNGVALDTIPLEIFVKSQQVSQFLLDTDFCPADSVVVSAEPNYSGYIWSDGVIGRQRTFKNEGEYWVSMATTGGCATIDSLDVKELPYMAPLAPGDTVLCEGEILSVQVQNGFSDAIWDNGFVGEELLVEEAGDYTVSAYDQNGCLQSQSVTVLVTPAPNPGLTGSINMCEGDTVEISVASNFSSYTWSTGEMGSTISVHSSGTYMITVVGDHGCIGIDTAQVNVFPLPSVQFSDSVMCNLDPMVLDIGAFAVYEWSNGDSTSFSLISSPGMYSVTVEDFNGCISQDSIIVSNVNVSVDLGNDTVICEGTSLFAQLSNNYDEILWDDGSTSNYHYIGSTGLHHVAVKTGTCEASDEISVVEEPVPTADFEFNVMAPSVDFINYSNTTNCTWYFGDGGSSNQISPQYAYNVYGLFEVILISENVCGSDTLSKEIGIYPQSIGNVGIGQHIKVYPTITSGQVSFEITDLKFANAEYILHDASGKLIVRKSFNYNGSKEVIDLSAFASGQYYLTIGVDDLKGISTTTVIKQ